LKLEQGERGAKILRNGEPIANDKTVSLVNDRYYPTLAVAALAADITYHDVAIPEGYVEEGDVAVVVECSSANLPDDVAMVGARMTSATNLRVTLLNLSGGTPEVSHTLRVTFLQTYDPLTE
jgi:hypothetical protein